MADDDRNFLLDDVLKRIEESQCQIQNLSMERQMLQSIDNDTIIKQIGMDRLALILFLLKIRNGEIGMFPIENDHVITSGELGVANVSYLPIFIHFFRIERDHLIIEGNIAVPTILVDDIKLILRYNEFEKEAELYDPSMDSYCGAYRYEDRRKFYISMPLCREYAELRFFYVINGEKCRIGKIIGMRFSPIADVLPGQYCIRNGYAFSVIGDYISCTPSFPGLEEELENQFQKDLGRIESPEAHKAIFRRQEYFRRKKQKKNPVWVFMDRIDRADDNAEVLYRYVKERGFADSYFIIQEGTEDYDRMQELGGIVPFYSEEHYQLVMLADYIISSQANGAVENPFWEEAEYYRDLYHQGKIIFLQHGVIKDDMSGTLYRFHTNFTGFITSSKAEWDSIVQGSYGYDEKQVWLTGLPRFDRMYNDDQKYILIMPSWRMDLMRQEWNEKINSMEWIAADDFKDSCYVNAWLSLLRNPLLQEACEKYGYRIAFMPHALMEPFFSEILEEEDSQFEFWDRSKSYREAFAQGSILVTDYSSTAFDFAYLEKPIVYYQFDKDSFFRTHSYDKGYYDYEKDGFGEVIAEENDLVDCLISYLRANCAVQEIYRARMQQTFAYRDGNDCKRICDQLIGRGI